MIVVSAALAVAAFVIGFHIFRVVPTASGIVQLARGATAVMSDKSLADEEKEKAVQKAALSMLGAAFSIFWRIAATMILTIFPIYLADWIGLVTAADVFSYLARVDVIVGASVLVGASLWIWSRRPKSKSAYSTMDRLVHRIAFAAPFVQATAADLEDSMFAKAFNSIDDKPPVFITSLPRAGTTIVLNALSGLPGVATHLYRDMPFVMAPILWSKFSRGFQKDSSLHERAHGDGIKIGYDSPEAFEEMIWHHFWPNHFRENEIALWGEADTNAEATDFMRRHFRKIIALRAGPGGRYVSKNNGNFARLDFLGAMFPDATVIVPVREPAEHAASLLRQHQNFLAQHASDPFIWRYMRDIGHFEFGALHRPIAFEGFAELAGEHAPDSPNYWLAYWIAAMSHVAARSGKLVILPDAKLQGDPQAVMELVCERAGIGPQSVDFTRHFHKIDKRADETVFDAGMLRRGRAIYDELNAARD